MWEHRLNEKMLASMMRHIDQIEKSKKINPLVIDVAVDFVRTYADRTHHGTDLYIVPVQSRTILGAWRHGKMSGTK